MKPFLKSVAEYLYKKHFGEFQSMAVVFPNKRARIYFNKYLSEVTDKPFFAPKYYTITEYMQEISESIVADQLSLLFMLYEVYVSVTKSEESFDDFLFYCEMLLADFDDIDKYLVDAQMLFKNLSDLKELDAYFDFLEEAQIKAIRQFWEAFSESKPSPEKESFSSLWQVLFKIYKRFNEVLDGEGISSEGNTYRKAIFDLKNTPKEAPGQKVMFIGFNALNKCEKELFKYIKEQGKAEFFWDYDNYYIKRKSYHEAAYFLGNLIREFPSPAGFNFDSDLQSEDRNIKVYNITTNTGQAKILPEIIKDLPPSWKSEPVKTTIALADETLLSPVLNAIPPEINEVNISMGYPLKETAVYSLIGVLLDLQNNKRIQKNDKEQYYYRDVLRVLQNGLISDTQNRETNELITEITKFNLVYLDANRLKINNNLVTDIFQPHINAANFVEYLISILKNIQYAGSEVKTQAHLIETEAAFRVITNLQRINDILLKTNVKYSFKSLVRLIGKILQGATVPFSGEPLSGVQIMGILETRTLDFDNLVILSMNEGTFPKSGHVPSFIPYNLRKAFGMPTIEHQDAIFGYYFYRLLQRSKNVSLVYTSSVQDSKTGEPSRFIQQLKHEKGFNVCEQTIGYNINPLVHKDVIVPKDNTSRKILTEKYSGENALTLSPSAINTYLNCNLRFYYRYIAGLKEPENVLEEVEANTLGSILHKTMEDLYLGINKKMVHKEDLEEVLKDKAKISLTILKSFWSEYLSPGKPFPGEKEVVVTGKNILVKEVVKKYAIAIIKYDIQHAPFEIIDLEKEHTFRFSLKNNIQITTGGIIDRLDKINGKIRVIDYKTGRLKDSFKDINELFLGKSTKRNDAAFQTLLYAMVVAKEQNEDLIEPGLYFVRNMQSKDYGYHLKYGERKKTHITSIHQVAEEFEELLTITLNEIFSTNGHFSQTNDLTYCETCPYKKLCAR